MGPTFLALGPSRCCCELENAAVMGHTSGRALAGPVGWCLAGAWQVARNSQPSDILMRGFEVELSCLCENLTVALAAPPGLETTSPSGFLATVCLIPSTCPAQ